jgi:hypothetical protein
VPRISEFFGIVVEMYFADHPPPHFHARCGGEEATVLIASGEILAGSLPGRVLGLVREWPRITARNSKLTGKVRADTIRSTPSHH